MTISSSLNAGVMGLNVNSTKLAAISDNIANSATNGYKRSDVDFSSLVLNQQGGIYSAGGVRAQSYKDIASQGALVSTGNSTDLAVNGDGMIPVTSIFGIDQLPTERDFLMVPTGSFQPDSDGNLSTTNGLYLLGWPIDATTGEAVTGGRDSTSGLVPVNVDVNQLSATPTRNMSLGLNLPADATDAGASGEPYSLPIEYYDNLGRAESLTYTFTPDVSGPGASNAWSVEVFDSAGSATVPVAEFDVTFSDTAANGGTIASVTPGTGTTYSGTTGEISFTVASGDMSAAIGEVGGSSGLTQLAGSFAPGNITKDGTPIGELRSVEINDQGIVEAIFNSGSRRSLYQIPLVDVPNFNGLKAVTNQAFTVTQESGDLYLWNAGEGPTGGLQSFALMESSTDIASELTSLIETQRAYSSNATIIQTVDEMLQETTNLKR